MNTVYNFINQLFANIRIQDIIDILLITYLVYKIFIFLKRTRAEQLIKGVVIILVLYNLSGWLQLFTVNWILNNAMAVGAFVLIVVFQPELRRGLEHIGRSSFLSKSYAEIQANEMKETVDAIVNAMGSLSRQRIGALIVIEKETGLKEIIETGTEINGKVSAELLINIFIPNTPLHDGAVIINGSTIRAASCFLPLSENMSISKEMGTRHRAALGISEKSDCLALVVSEETGTISIAEGGTISRHLDLETLSAILMSSYKSEEDRRSITNLWRRINETTKGDTK